MYSSTKVELRTCLKKHDVDVDQKCSQPKADNMKLGAPRHPARNLWQQKFQSRPTGKAARRSPWALGSGKVATWVVIGS